MYEFIFMYPGKSTYDLDRYNSKIEQFLLEFAWNEKRDALLSIDARDHIIKKLQEVTENFDSNINDLYKKIIYHYLRKTEEHEKYIADVEKWCESYDNAARRYFDYKEIKDFILYIQAYINYLRKNYSQTEKLLLTIVNNAKSTTKSSRYAVIAARQLEIIYYKGYENSQPNVYKSIAYLIKSLHFGERISFVFDGLNNRYGNETLSYLHMIFCIIFSDKELRKLLVTNYGDVLSEIGEKTLSQKANQARKQLYKTYTSNNPNYLSYYNAPSDFEYEEPEKYKLFLLDSFIAELTQSSNTQLKVTDFIQVLIECIKLDVVRPEFLLEFITIMSLYNFTYLKNQLFNIELYYYYKQENYQKCISILETFETNFTGLIFDISLDTNPELPENQFEQNSNFAFYSVKKVPNLPLINFKNTLNYCLFKNAYSKKEYDGAVKYLNQISEEFVDYDETALSFARELGISDLLTNQTAAINILNILQKSLKPLELDLEQKKKDLEAIQSENEKEKAKAALNEIEKSNAHKIELLNKVTDTLQSYENPIYKFKTIIQQIGIRLSPLGKINSVFPFFSSSIAKVAEANTEFQNFIQNDPLINNIFLPGYNNNFVIKNEDGVTVKLSDYETTVLFSTKLLAELKTSVELYYSQNDKTIYIDVLHQALIDLKFIQAEIKCLEIKNIVMEINIPQQNSNNTLMLQNC